jgi:predicted dehydrogenase
MKAIEAVLMGAGGRGRHTVGAYAARHPEQVRFVAVAELDEGRRMAFAEKHRIPKENCFASYEEMLARPQLAPLCFNTTMDKQHRPSAVAALEKGYHLFLEKPMADTPEGCLQIAQVARKHRRMVQICHPLRYTPFYRQVKSALESGVIGKIISISHYENVAYWHFAHSFVRGNWGRVETSGPLILTKCCHDMDLVTWLADSKVKSVSSAGTLYWFREENAPEGAPARCLEGCPVEDTCPFYAPKAYLTEYTDWPVSAISLDTSLEARRKALETGPYGRCVFRCDNTAVDHQVVCAQFENDISMDFAVRGNTFHPFRTLRIIGTEGELNGHLERSEFSILRFAQGIWVDQKPDLRQVAKSQEGGHSGGDPSVIANFLRCYRENDTESIEHSLEIAVEGHLLAFAAEEARQSEQTVNMNWYKEKIS